MMFKNPFRYFLLSGRVIILIGLFLEIKGDKIFFNRDESFRDYHFIKGWYVMSMGGIMLLLGIILRLSLRKNENDFIKNKNREPVASDWIADGEHL